MSISFFNKLKKKKIKYLYTIVKKYDKIIKRQVLIMAFWNKKKMFDVVKTFFVTNNATYTVNNNEISFEIHFDRNEFTLYPYININEDKELMSISVNIREISKKDLTSKVLFNLNEFNSKSIYFKSFVNDDNILYLEYNTFTNVDNVSKVLQDVVDSLFNLSDLINEL
jgi:hypothetical protein